jgi:hypothetical protein
MIIYKMITIHNNTKFRSSAVVDCDYKVWKSQVIEPMSQLQFSESRQILSMSVYLVSYERDDSVIDYTTRIYFDQTFSSCCITMNEGLEPIITVNIDDVVCIPTIYDSFSFVDYAMKLGTNIMNDICSIFTQPTYECYTTSAPGLKWSRT